MAPWRGVAWRDVVLGRRDVSSEAVAVAVVVVGAVVAVVVVVAVAVVAVVVEVGKGSLRRSKATLVD